MSVKTFLQEQGLMEGAPKPAPVPHTHVTPLPHAPDASPPMPFTQQTAFAPVPSSALFTAPAPVVAPIMDEAAQAQLKTIETAVYRQQNSPYVLFQNVRATLNNTSDFSSVFKVLVASGSGVTPQKVLASIEDHLAIIAQSHASFEHDLQQAKAEQIDNPTTKIADLTKANQDATNQIAARNQEILQLQQTIQHGQTAVQNGAARFKAIEDQLSAPLLQTKQLISSQGA